jgi:hypothetical protein
VEDASLGAIYLRFFVGIVLWYVAKQLDVIARCLSRIEARLALMRPMPSEMEMQETLEDEAGLGR